MRAHLRAGVRLGRLVWVLFKGWWWVRFVFPGASSATQHALITQWARLMLAAMGLTLQTHGQVRVAGPVLLVSNHISWVDILALMAIGPCRFVSKAQVHHWPIVGTMAAGAGTLFIERESPRDAMRVMHHMAQVLEAGDTVAVFPEGTTSSGDSVMAFHANLFQAAIAARASVQPLALAYFDGSGGHCSSQVAFVGEDNLLHSLRKVLMAHELSVRVAIGVLSKDEGQGRRQWAQAAHREVTTLHTQLCCGSVAVPLHSEGLFNGR